MSPDRRARRRRRNIDLVLFALAVFGVLVGVDIFFLHLQSDPLADVHAYYDAATRLNAGLPLYEQAATTNQAEFYRYPPLFAMAFRPLALLPYATASLIWEALVVASFIGLLWLLRPGKRGWLLMGILSMPILWGLSIGQAQVPMTLLMAIGAPWSIALAANLKVLPALVAIWWIGRRDWRSLIRFAVWMVVFGLVQLVLDPADTLKFPSVFTLGQVGEVRNWSPYVVSPVLWAGLVIAGTAVAFKLAPTRWGWAAAVALAVLATPRLLLYQLMTLVVALREPAATAGPATLAAPAAADPKPAIPA